MLGGLREDLKQEVLHRLEERAPFLGLLVRQVLLRLHHVVDSVSQYLLWVTPLVASHRLHELLFHLDIRDGNPVLFGFHHIHSDVSIELICRLFWNNGELWGFAFSFSCILL